MRGKRSRKRLFERTEYSFAHLSRVERHDPDPMPHLVVFQHCCPNLAAPEKSIAWVSLTPVAVSPDRNSPGATRPTGIIRSLSLTSEWPVIRKESARGWQDALGKPFNSRTFESSRQG